jgi:hypothetical protein
MAEGPEIIQRVAFERARRARLGVPVAAGGVLYLLGAIIVYQVFAGLRTVGLLQALQPALNGKALTTVSPRAQEIEYISHHAFPLIAGGVLEGIAFAALTALLLFLLDAVRFRAPEPSPAARMLVLVGGGGTAVVSIAAEIVRAVSTHEFVTGGRFGERAVEQAVSTGAANVIVGNLDLLLPIVLVVGMIMAILRATRVGLIPRWLRGTGILAAILLLPLFSTASLLQVVPAAWMAFMGMLLLGKLPSGEPPAWEAGEAVPWPPGGAAARGAGQRSEASPKPALASATGGAPKVAAGALAEPAEQVDADDAPPGAEGPAPSANGARGTGGARGRARAAAGGGSRRSRKRRR